MNDFLVGLALVFVIEGLLYAAFPDQLKTMMAQVIRVPSPHLRKGGLIALGVGVFIVWLLRG